MQHCPACDVEVKLAALLSARAPARNFQRDSMRFRVACPGCNKPIGIGQNSLRIFFVAWLLPAPFLAAASSWVAPGTLAMALPIAWLIILPITWLSHVRLVSLESGK